MAEVKGGDKLAKKLDEMARRLSRANAVAVGFLAGATYPTGTSVAAVAAWQNWGTGRIPPRPFFSNMIAAKSPGWPAAIAENLKHNKYDSKKTLDQVGEAVAGQLRESLINTNSPPLAASTLARRGVPGMVYNPKDPKTFGAKPLVRTGHLLASIDKEVR